MPELPDVETWKRYVDATSLHQKIDRAEIRAPQMREGISADRLGRKLRGDSFAETRRHGKFLFVGLEKGGWLVLHFGMTGYLRYGKDADENADDARLAVRFENGYTLAGFWSRRLGKISFTDDPADFAESKQLGPDALAAEIDRDRFAELCRGRRGMTKTALMDQGFLAGIGNVYSDEILFQARIHPRADLQDLSGKDLTRLFRKMHHVLETATERQADPDRMPRSWLLPHRQEGAACPRCGEELQKIGVGGRRGYVCPDCQRTPG